MAALAQMGQPGKDPKRFRDLGVKVLVVLSLLCILLVGGTQAQLVSDVAVAPITVAKPPAALPPVTVQPPVVAPVALAPAATKPAPVTAPAASVIPPAVAPVVAPPKTAPVAAPVVVVPPAVAPVQAPVAPAPKVAPIAPVAAPGPAVAKPPALPAGNGSLDPNQVGALRLLGLPVGGNACEAEPTSVLTCNMNSDVQHLMTLSVQDCPLNASLLDLDFNYLATDALTHLSFINCPHLLSPSEPPPVLSTYLLDFFLMSSFSPIYGWWLGRLHALQNLTVLDVSVVTTSGLDVILSNMDNLKYLAIENATLSGTLPTAWPQNLNSILLSGNSLSGTIPVALTKLVHLEVLDLSHNSLGGALPSYIGNLKNVQTLNLQNNGFTGGIPKSIANMRALTKLDLSFNNLNGSIPQELDTLALTDLDLRNNTLLTGAIPFSTAALTNMKSLLVSGTSLCYNPTVTSSKLARSLNVPLCGGLAPTLPPAYGPAFPPTPGPAPPATGTGHKKKPKIVVIVLSALAVLVVVGGIVYCCCRWWGAREGYA